MKKKILIITGVLFLMIFMLFFMYSYSKRIDFTNNIKDKIKVELVKCIDGDTATFKVDNKTKNYRFLAIDAPEIDTDFGKIVSEYTCNELKNAKEIKIKYDEYGKTIDKYNRELVWIFIDDKLLQDILLEKGYAKVKYVYVNYDYLNELYKKESIAQDKKEGLWGNYNSKVYNDYYTITFNYEYKNDIIKVLENNHVNSIKNPYKYGCRFIG